MSNTLVHYGILGMKWGIRRTPAQLSRDRGTPKKSSGEKKNVKEMSDDELRRTVNRLQLERQYSQLSSSNVSKGREYVQKIIKAGTTVAAVTTTALTLHNNAGKIKAILKKIK
jgi:hypothetical protein